MENKILIVLAVFSISILLAQVYINNANAITFSTVSFGATGVTNEFRNCEYNSSTEVWCPTTTGIKIWNPTTRTVTNTLYSGVSINDIKCTGTYCYSWDVVSTSVGNLTQWNQSGKTFINSTLFTGNSGFQVGHGIGLATGTGSVTLMLPVEGQTCLGTADNKGVCIFNGLSFIPDRFITSGSTNDGEVIYDIEWNEGVASVGEPTANRALVKYRNLGGTFLWQLINLADGDTTFATTRVCETASLTGTSQQSKFVIINGILYDTYSTSDLLVMDTTLDTCATSAKLNLIDESTIRTTTYDSNDDIFIISATNVDGGTEESGIYVFNGTTLDQINTTWQKILKVNTTSTTNPSWTHFNHASEGEIHVWIGSNMLIIGELIDSTGGDTPQDQFCELPENFNILSCVLARGNTTPLVGASELIGESSNTIVCQLGLIECTDFVPNNPDTKTNGVGYLILFVALGIMIGIFWVASRGDLGSIPTFLWFIATLSIVGVITAFDLIDPTVLIIAIIAIIALATARAKGIFGSSGLFAGET